MDVFCTISLLNETKWPSYLQLLVLNHLHVCFAGNKRIY